MLSETINAYAFQQYADDDDIQLYFGMFNAASQAYLDWFNSANLAYYPGLSGAMLQWVAAGLYGEQYFSAIEASGTPAIGPLNTSAANEVVLNDYVAPTETFYAITDDVFQRIITWNFYKGDGRRFCVRWLKRRIMRFILGVNGIDPQPWNLDEEDLSGFVGCENTQGISVQFSASYLSAPTQTTASTSTAGGTGLAASTAYYYVITAESGSGETTKSNEESVTTGAGSTNSNTVHFTLPTGATGGKVYRGTAAGLENVYYTVGPGATSFVDTGAAATSGSPPTTNSATASRTCTISLNQLVLSALTQLTPNILQIFKALFLAPTTPLSGGADWVLEKPIEYTYVVNINTTLTALVSPSSLSVVGATASETTGAATAVALGGSGSYTYAWVWLSGGTGITINSASANSTTFTASSLTSGQTLTGVAKCTVTDTSTLLTSSDSVNVSIERVSIPSATPSPSSITAFGATSNITSSQVQVGVTDGQGPYTFAWIWQSGGTSVSIDSPSTSATTFTAIGLSTGGSDSGTALCTVTDAYGQQTTCTVAVSITRATPVSAIISPNSLSVLSASSSETTGTTTVTASGGIAPYTYAWAWQSGGASITIDSPSADATAFSTSGLPLNTTASGTAVCTVRDSVGQQAQVTCAVSITRASAVTASVSPSSQTSSGSASTQTTGVSTVTASGGSGVYTYSWAWISGGSHLAINSPTSKSTSFTGSGMSQVNTYSGIARCTITDGYGQQTTVSVPVTVYCVAPFLQRIYTSGSGTEIVPTGYSNVVIEDVGGGSGGQGGFTDGGVRPPAVYGGQGGTSGSYCRSSYACSGGQTLAWSVGLGGTAGANDFGSPGPGGTSTVSSGSLSITTMTAPGGLASGSPTGGNQANTAGNPGTAGGQNVRGTGGAPVTGEYLSGEGGGGNGGLGGVGNPGNSGAVSFYYTP